MGFEGGGSPLVMRGWRSIIGIQGKTSRRMLLLWAEAMSRSCQRGRMRGVDRVSRVLPSLTVLLQGLVQGLLQEHTNNNIIAGLRAEPVIKTLFFLIIPTIQTPISRHHPLLIFPEFAILVVVFILLSTVLLCGDLLFDCLLDKPNIKKQGK